jgi:hypothetical protein
VTLAVTEIVTRSGGDQKDDAVRSAHRTCSSQGKLNNHSEAGKAYASALRTRGSRYKQRDGGVLRQLVNFSRFPPDRRMDRGGDGVSSPFESAAALLQAINVVYIGFPNAPRGPKLSCLLGPMSPDDWVTADFVRVPRRIYDDPPIRSHIRFPLFSKLIRLGGVT